MPARSSTPRAPRTGRGADVTGFHAEYGLGSAEGVALLCLAEALLRIPDAATADALIEDRIAGADWQKHLGHGDSLAVNASAWAFMLTGRVLALDNLAGKIGGVIRRLSEPANRTALRRGVRVLARQFVMGRTIGEARADRRRRYGFDMLGEAAKTHADAERYRLAYLDAIGAIGRSAVGSGPIHRTQGGWADHAVSIRGGEGCEHQHRGGGRHCDTACFG